MAKQVVNGRRTGVGATAMLAALVLMGAAEAASARDTVFAPAGEKQVIAQGKSSSVSPLKRLFGGDKARKVYIGRAPWICTPSGFGRTASCFARTSTR